MTGASHHRRAPRWIALGALAALVAGVALGVRQWQSRPPAGSTETSEPAGEDAQDLDADAAVEQALRQTPGVDLKLDKSRWVDEVVGVDVSGLARDRREAFVRFANAQRCTCGCGYTLAGCRVYDSSCEVSLPILERLLDSVRAGKIPEQRHLRSRPARQRTAVAVDR